jgi:hypothetical protein
LPENLKTAQPTAELVLGREAGVAVHREALSFHSHHPHVCSSAFDAEHEASIDQQRDQQRKENHIQMEEG